MVLAALATNLPVAAAWLAISSSGVLWFSCSRFTKAETVLQDPEKWLLPEGRSLRTTVMADCRHTTFANGPGARTPSPLRSSESFSIVTTDAAPSTAKYHDRMPLVLEEAQFENWMRTPSEEAAKMMQLYGGALEIWEVSPDVGNVKNNRPELMERAALL